jgi:glycosyltransferase involved in cell wall biosynthesis
MTATVPDPTEPAVRLPTFSVVVPNYNHAHYLEAALHAHLSQSVPPLEIIVVDDGSTDDSCAIVERVAAEHPSVRLIRLPRNGGVNPAINRGLREACGDYVFVSAADDLAMPQFAARSLAVAAAYPDAGLCFSDPAVMMGDDGVVEPWPLALSLHPCLFSPADLERHLKRGYFASLPANTVLYRRDALLALGGFVEELRWWADTFASSVLAFRHGACYVPAVLAVFRVRADSYSQRGSRDTAAQRDVINRVVDLLDSSAYRDIAPAFRASALLPHLRFRLLLWLLASPRHRRYLTPRLVTRVLVRGTWRVLKPYMPQPVRLAVRRLAYSWARFRGPGGRRGR